MIKVNNQHIELKIFPDGTPLLKINHEAVDALVEWYYEANEEMMLYYIVRHLRERCGVAVLNLYMPYIPNARMDRVKNDNEVFTLKYFCEFINSMNFNKVMVKDAHSNVSLALLNCVTEKNVIPNVESIIHQNLTGRDDIIFYPDEGSCKRYSDKIHFPYAFGIKQRCWETGEILGMNVCGEVPNNPFDALIVDDICSYGGTFFHTAKKLKELGAKRIYLYVTHCENSVLNGDMIKSGLIDKIYTTNSIYKGNHPDIIVLGDN